MYILMLKNNNISYGGIFMTMTAREIVSSVGMSNLPAVYANRAAIWTDLSATHLTGIHNKIKLKIGTSAAEAFVTMVECINILSAYNFLNALYALEERGWVYAPFKETDLGVGPGDTEYIRNTFLAGIHKIPFPKNEYTEHLYRSF